MRDYAIHARGLPRYFGSKTAVQQLDLAMPRGSVCALVGRNGSGKTTTIRMLLGLLQPTRGRASVLGCDSVSLTPRVRARIGYLAEGHFVYGWMRVRGCARFQSQCFPRWNQRVFNAVIEHFGIDPSAKARTLSRGQRAGLCLALTLAPEPELLVLDDPAMGLDPVARRSLVEAMLAFTRDKGRTVLLSSHLLDDVERLADRLVILDRGVLRVHARVETFCERVGCWVLRFVGSPPCAPAVRGLVHSRVLDSELHVTIANPDEQTESALAGLGAVSVARVPLSMENAILAYLRERGQTSLLLEAVGVGGSP